MNIPLDEVELYLEVLKANSPEEIEYKTYEEIASIIETKFGVECDSQDVFLLHEPTIYEMEEDLRIQFETLGLNY